MEGLVVLSVVLAAVTIAEATEVSNTVSVSIRGRTNQTGHQITQFEIFYDRVDGIGQGTVPWQLDVQQGVKESSRYLLASLSVNPAPAQDYQFFPLLGRYKIHTLAKSWSEAYHICQQEGAHLAIINSDTEAHVLMELYKRSPKAEGATYDGSAYIGLNDLVTEGKYVTVFGEDISKTGYVKWSKGEPNNSGGSDTNPGQDCGVFLKSSGLFDDARCTNKFPFICEQEL
ncbi:hemolymph lipopolysaccharide-binding protein [Anabrus simplex]|uniref:hemolymph lipopolysaccharide-binding protein n=1 Tax=Anabrus simplex TaxID=316456 RepID=UPI0035A3A690